MNIQRFDDQQGNLWKYVFSTDDMIAEAVLVREESFSKHTAIYCSVMSGCPVGCKICGAGKKFIRKLNSDEIAQQVEEILKDQDLQLTINNSECFQILFTNMGEPLLNWSAVELAVRRLHNKYPAAQLVISTIGPNVQRPYEKLLKLSKEIPQVELQFTLSRASDIERDHVIPYKKKLALSQIRDIGILWNRVTLRPVWLNYCLDSVNSDPADLIMIQTLFSPVVFAMAFDFNTSKDDDYNKSLDMNSICENFKKAGYNIGTFNIIGKNTIGAGQGQLWNLQQYKNDNDNNNRVF